MSERSALPAQPVLLARRTAHSADTIVRIGSIPLGANHQPVVIAGPCVVESEHQIMEAARAAGDAGAHLLRGGLFGPPPPRGAHGWHLPGVRWLARAGAAAGLPVVCAVRHPELLPAVAEVADAVQIGSRSRHRTSLLRAAGRCERPVLLERSAAATLDDWLLAAEEILAAGNPQVILCERGIPMFEPATHKTLGLHLVPLAKTRTHLPIVVEPSPGTGRRELVLPMSLAAIAAGAHGLLIAVAAPAAAARSDEEPAIDPATLRAIIRRAPLVQVAAQLPPAQAVTASTPRSAGDGMARRSAFPPLPAARPAPGAPGRPLASQRHPLPNRTLPDGATA